MNQAQVANSLRTMEDLFYVGLTFLVLGIQ